MEKELLDQLIKASGLTQKEVSEKTDIPAPHINRWLKGTRTPKLSTIYDMALQLGYKINFTIEKI